MKEAKGNLLTVGAEVLVITTNGFIKKNGACVMGAGIARQIRDLVPGIDKYLGQQIARHGNKPHVLAEVNGIKIVSMPVKPEVARSNGHNYVAHKYFPIGDTVPGWACRADLELIKRSATRLAAMADEYGWTDIAMPRAGCGAGELDWGDVKPVLEEILDDRFTAYTF